MHTDRAVVLGATGFIVLVMVLSGPLGVDGLSTPPAGPPADAGNGSVGISAVELPDDGVRFDQRDSQVERYELVVPTAVVEIDSVSGHPILLYELQIPSMGYGQTGIFFLDVDAVGSNTLVMPDDHRAADMVTESTYEGALLVKTRSSDGDQVIARQNVTVEVVE